MAKLIDEMKFDLARAEQIGGPVVTSQYRQKLAIAAAERMEAELHELRAHVDDDARGSDGDQ